MPEVREYIDANGRSPFSQWLKQQAGVALVKVAAHVKRLEQGNLSNVAPVGGGVHEKRIDWGPGLRLYFGNDGHDLIILLAGSEKGDQQKTIGRAMEYWIDYRLRRQSNPWR
jgi:putative addiction module killer protein